MADIGAQLSIELTRIIESPYPAALCHLADLLARADVLTIRACIYNRPPCAVSRLVTLVCDELPLAAYTLSVLSALCQSPEFRDTLLLEKPGLLNALLTKANSSPQHADHCAKLCVLLLSRPLPKAIPLPASAQPFFLRTFENANQNPDEKNFKTVYSLLNGACRNLLTQVPALTRQQFDGQLHNVLCSQSAGQAFLLLLWCFGIVLLAEHPAQNRLPQNAESTLGQPKQWSTKSGRKVFGSVEKLQHKTMYLTSLSVIWALKSNVEEEATEAIRVAFRTLQCIDRATLQAWPRSSKQAQDIFSKLLSKIFHVDITPAVQIEAIAFYATIAGEGNLPTSIVAQYERCLGEIPSLVNTDCLEETLTISLPLFAPQMRETTVQALVAGVLDTCASPQNAHQISNYITLVEQVTLFLPLDASFQASMLSAVTLEELQAKVWNFVRANAGLEFGGCQANATSLHRQLMSATLAMLLTLALASQPSGPRLPLALSTALIAKQKQLQYISNQCSHLVAVAEPATISFFEQKNTPYTGQHLQDWKDRLKVELESQSHYQRNSIVRSVAHICQDLETRCNTVEEPLRRERARSQAFEQQVAKLGTRVATLEGEVTDYRLHLEGLEDEKLSTSDEKDRLELELSKLKSGHQDAVRRADDVLRNTREDFNAREMELQSTIITYEENTRAQEKETQAQNNILHKLTEDLDLVRGEHDALSKQHDILQHRLDDTEQKLNGEYDINHGQSQQIAALKVRNNDLELQLQGTEEELETTSSQLSDLQVSHQELIRSSEEAHRTLEMKYNNSMQEAEADAKAINGRLETRLCEAMERTRQAEEAHDKTRGDLEVLQTLIPPLENKIQELNDFCSEQEEELEELRTMRRTFLQGLGFATQHPLAIRSATRASDDAIEPTPRVRREHRRRKSAVHTLQDVPRVTGSTQGISSTTMESIANASFASSDSYSSQNGSTPKRRKPGPSSKLPVIQTPRTQKPVFPTRSVSKKLSPSKRTALRQLSPNRRHTTVGFAVPETEEEDAYCTRSVRKRRGSLQGIEEADFDMDDFLAGTPLTPGNFTTGTGRILDDTDVTTTEL
ncbi:hypothetical protein CC86DRAFT_328478 [Ophiobolus disseminans]|uniref:Uncharacterized protein n=1 Tax=Ophiobolus disseminans TaxID=1469910 RepID=A0A6A6ZR41_9PLEO|nr:hypothetical protein CC86DRAFT_328478 [Ophiobolus disseminans]